MKKLVTTLLCFVLVVSSSMPAFARATSSDADIASSSNAFLDYDAAYDRLLGFTSVPLASPSDAVAITLLDDNLMLLSDDGYTAADVSNMFDAIDSTIEDWSKVKFYVNYEDEYGSHGNSVPLKKRSDGRGQFTIDWSDLTGLMGETLTINYFSLQIPKSSLPPTGVYTCNFGFMLWSAYADCFDFYNDALYSRKYINNANYQQEFVYVSSVTTNSKNVLFPFNLDVANTDYIEWRIYPDNINYGSLFPFTATVVMEFTKTSDSADYVAAGGSYTSGDAVIDISSSVNGIYDSLQELIQHISDQLAALWDQMYNYMHLPHLANDDKNTQLIIDKLGDDLNVEITNQDNNTEEIINGFDNSGMSAANNELSESINTYDAAETEIFDNVSGYISEFEIPEFSNNDSGVLGALSFCSDYLQRLFVAIGIFNAPITVSLTFIFVLMLLGYYRVRSHG